MLTIWSALCYFVSPDIYIYIYILLHTHTHAHTYTPKYDISIDRIGMPVASLIVDSVTEWLR